MILSTSEVILQSPNTRFKSASGEGIEAELGCVHYRDPALHLSRNKHIFDDIVEHVDHSLNHIIYILFLSENLPFLWRVSHSTREVAWSSSLDRARRNNLVSKDQRAGYKCIVDIGANLFGDIVLSPGEMLLQCFDSLWKIVMHSLKPSQNIRSCESGVSECLLGRDFDIQLSELGFKGKHLFLLVVWIISPGHVNKAHSFLSLTHYYPVS